MSIYRKEEDISKHLPRTFYLFGIETDLEAIQLSYFLGLIKALIAQFIAQSSRPALWLSLFFRLCSHCTVFVQKRRGKTSVFVKVFTLICTKTPHKRRLSKMLLKVDIHKNGGF